MQIEHAPLEVMQYYIKNINLNFSPKIEGVSDGALMFSADLAKNSEDPLQWKLGLTVKINQENADDRNSVRGEIKVEGIFKIRQNVPECDHQKLIENAGFSILYGAVRDIVLIVSGHAESGRHILPALSFIPDQDSNQIENKS